MPTVRRRLGAELCTQAWCKMMEMACSHNLLQPSPSPEDGVTPCFRSFHLCEAPGGFVSATNHYLCSNYGEVDWDWLAITLNPYYEVADADGSNSRHISYFGHFDIGERFIFYGR